METISHKCIKCQVDYSDTEIDNYYCSACFEEKQKIAKELDKKFATSQREPVISELSKFDEIRRRTGKNFVNIRDLGISL